MKTPPLVLFGEAERGEFHAGYYCKTLEELVFCFGNPPIGSRGLDFAVQTLLFNRSILFFRVEEEGYSIDDYAHGFDIIANKRPFEDISALCMPGVGNEAILDVAIPLCKHFNTLLITSEPDLYDLLTDR